MATSGTYSFSVSRNEIIRQAMLNIGVLDPRRAPTSVDISDCAFQLNMLVKQMQGKSDFAPGMKVWTRRRGHLFLRSSTGQYTVGPSGTGWTQSYTATTTTAAASAGATAIVVSSATGFAANYYVGVEDSTGDLFWTTVSSVASTTINLNSALTNSVEANAQVFVYQTISTQPIVIESVVLRDAESNDVPLRVMDQVTYDALPSKVAPTNISDPGAIYYEFQLTNSYLYTDVAGAADVTKHLVLTYLEAIQDFNNPLDEPEYPQEMYSPLCWGLAKMIASMYDAVWTPLMQSNYEEAMAVGRHKDVENSSAYFQPGND